jgi:hypothetical protein
MGIRRTSHLTVRPDGTLERVATPEPTTGNPDDDEKLGSRFEELLQEGDRRDAAAARDAQQARQMMPARFPWRDPTRQAATRAADQATADRGRDAGRAKDARAAEDAEDHRDEQVAEAAAQGGAHAKERRSGDQQEGQQSGSGGQSGDSSAALAALQGELARPQPIGGTPAPASPPPPSGSREISEVAAEVAARISTARSHGAAQVQIDLREDLLPQTSMTIEDQAGTIVVTVNSGSDNAAQVLSSHAQELGQAISRRTGKSTRINLGDQSWTAEADQSAADTTRSPDDG